MYKAELELLPGEKPIKSKVFPTTVHLLLLLLPLKSCGSIRPTCRWMLGVGLKTGGLTEI